MKTNLTNVSILTLALLMGGVGVASAYTPFGGANQDLTNEQLKTMESVHELRANGNYQEARELLQDSGFARGRGLYRNEHREKAQTAVSNNDYLAFQTAVEGSPMEGVVTPEIFSEMVKAHTLRDSGDLEGAREIMQNLNIGKGQGFMMGGERKGHGLGRGNWNR